MKAWINGQFVGLAEAKVGYFDGGFQHAIGLFETMLARDGAVLRLEAHLERLAASAKLLRLFDNLRIEPLAETIQLCLAENAMSDARPFAGCLLGRSVRSPWRSASLRL